MSAHETVGGAHATVLLAILTTDRPNALARLLESARELAGDRSVAAVVFDNSSSARFVRETRTLVHKWAAESLGPRLLAHPSCGGLPLHEARLAFTRSIADSNLGRERPIVWMLDDDLRFEAIDTETGRVVSRNVALLRIEQVRAAARRGQADLLVGSFTGDPPIRPDAVQATQLGDLAHAVESFARLSPNDFFHPIQQRDRTPDDFYDHAERDALHLDVRHPWIPRSVYAATVRAEFRDMCRESERIICGGTPFRPLFEADAPRPRLTSAPARGGNAIFLNWKYFQQHPYPAVRLSRGWSRRADMIGSALLVRSFGARVFEGGLTLRHDRDDQAPARFDAATLACELAGVLLVRAVTGRLPAGGLRLALARYAVERVARIAAAQRLALHAGARAAAALEDRQAWWTAEADPAAAVLAGRLRDHLSALEDQCLDHVAETVFDLETLETIADAAQALLRSTGALESTGTGGMTCVGG